MSKTYNNECSEVKEKIETTMRLYTEAVENSETYFLDKVEKMRKSKINELNQYMNTLRGMLAGLSRISELIIHSMDSDGKNLFMIKEKGKYEVHLFSTMFKNMQVKEERILFNSPNCHLIDQLGHCDVQRIYPTSGQIDNSDSHQILMAMQSLLAGQSTICLPRSIGQAIPGCWKSVSVKPTSSLRLGEPMFSFGREGPNEAEIARPWGLCVDREGNVIVADRRNDRIQIFSKDGEFKSMFGSKGDGPGQFDLPSGITTDIFDRIIVADKDNHRIQIFTMVGKYILQFGSFGKKCGQFHYPWDVATNTLGNIVVTDTRNHRIQLFTTDGIFVTQYVFESPNSTTMLRGPTIPRGVSFTTFGNIVVTDFENNRIIMLDSTLSKVLHCAESEGFSTGELNRPSGVAIDDEGRIIVADSKNYRVVLFTSQLRRLSTVNFKSTDFDKDRPSDVALTLEGHLVTETDAQDQQYEDYADETEEDEEYAPNITDSRTSVTKLRSISSKIKRSEIVKKKFQSTCEAAGVSSNLNPILDCPTRWNSTHDMIGFGLKVRADINILCSSVTELKDFQITDSEWQILEKIHKFLINFKVLSTKIGEEKYVTLPLVIVSFNLLLDKIESMVKQLDEKPNRSEVDERLILAFQAARDKILKHYKKSNWIYCTSLILDLRHKAQIIDLTIWGKQLKIESLRKFNELNEEYYSLHSLNKSLELPRKENKVCDEDENVIDFVKLYECPSTSSGSCLQGLLIDELKYLRKPRAASSEDILDWWRMHETEYPTLSKMARDLLSITATSIPAERLFSKASLVIKNIEIA
ncbi:unnamed protein product [Diatraea saccharalis]|uniref:HAT C-terminal dimerisation domain-containing protein n=1 Tax=Diatraea saccharalis TaxID=40085 RepID=A0A9P1FC02_9NEOP|nr:unnamed protein product [Diatraea saccharalis]